MNLFKSKALTTVAAGVAAIGALVATGTLAQAGSTGRQAFGDEGSVYHFHINDQVEADLMKTPANSVWTESINKFAVTKDKLHPAVVTELGYGKSGDKIVVPAKLVEKVGGSFTANATSIATFQLPAGAWLLPVSARFDRVATGPADGNRPQLAVRYDNGKDAGTVMGQELSGLKDRELTGADNKVVTISETTTFTVYGFGYNDDQSASGGNTFAASAEITPVRVG